MSGVDSEQPLKEATPFTAAFAVPPAHENVPACLLIVRVIVRWSVVTTLPPASTTATEGCGASADPVGFDG